MKVLITGRDGQLAQSLAECATGDDRLELHFAGRPAADLEQPGSIAQAIAAMRPDVVINAAAYTDVDRAEKEPERAFRINAEAAGEVAAAAASVNAAIIQLSTDYVFDGSAAGPYREDAATNPINVYGASKLAGEQRVRAANDRHIIIRSSWLVGPFGRNFMKTMLRLAHERDEIEVVADQWGTPTGTPMLAEAILAVLGRWSDPAHRDQGLGDLYHVAGAGVCSWAELAAEVMRSSAAAGTQAARIIPIASSAYPTTARRPSYSALDASRFAQAFTFPLEPWRPMVERLVARLDRDGGRRAQ